MDQSVIEYYSEIPESVEGTIISKDVDVTVDVSAVVDESIVKVFVVAVEGVLAFAEGVCAVDAVDVDVDDEDEDEDEEVCKLAGMPFLNSGNNAQNLTSLALKRIDDAASCFFSSIDVGGSMPPYMISSLRNNDIRPMRIVVTDHVGFHVSG